MRRVEMQEVALLAWRWEMAVLAYRRKIFALYQENALVS